MSKTHLFPVSSKARLQLSARSKSGDLSSLSEKNTVRKAKKKRSKSLGPRKVNGKRKSRRDSAKGLSRFLASTKSVDGALSKENLNLIDILESTPEGKKEVYDEEIGGEDLDAARSESSLKSGSEKCILVKKESEFDCAEYLRSLPLDSLVSIIRAIGADDSKCYGRADFIGCIMLVVHGGINPNFFEEEAQIYRCPICFEIHRHDTKLLECQHFIGESCYRDWGAKSKMKGCPLCRSHIEFGKSQDLTSKLRELKLVRCPFHFECSWTGTWKELDRHVLTESDSVKTVSRSWRRNPARKRRSKFRGLRGGKHSRSADFGTRARVSKS